MNTNILLSCSITYPAISAFVSMQTDADKQGLVQGMITGMRGLCNGLGPAMYGLIFSLFHVDLNESSVPETDTEDHFTKDMVGTAGNHRAPPPFNTHINHTTAVPDHSNYYPGVDFASITSIIPGPPFVFGAFLVMLALMVAAFIPEDERIRVGNDSCSGGGGSMYKGPNLRRHNSHKGAGGKTGRKKKSDDSDTEDSEELLRQITSQYPNDHPDCEDKDDSISDEDYDYMTTVPLMEGVKDRGQL